MSEHWKSTPKYWCKHCATYVRDTKLERTNHEATGKHQGAVKRALSNLHRAANAEERERDRARREIDRLNGVVKPAPTNPSGSSTHGSSGGEAERKRQAEQLAALGVALPQAFRGDLAMPGEWSVTTTTVVREEVENGDDGEKTKSKTKGIHKRERTDEEREHEEAVEGLFKKPRRWGRDTAHAGGEASVELDALLSGGLGLVANNKKEEGEEIPAKAEAKDGRVKEEGDQPVIKKEASTEADQDTIPAHVPVAVVKVDVSVIKTEDGEASQAANLPAVAFKKRKPKNIRQK